MESNLLKIDCLKEEEVVFPRAKKKKRKEKEIVLPCNSFKDVAYHHARQEQATQVNHQESVKKHTHTQKNPTH